MWIPKSKIMLNKYVFFKEITKWIDEGSPVDIIYSDVQKAFDKVPHQRSLLTLIVHGIGDDIIDWIEKWLTDREQRAEHSVRPSVRPSVRTCVPECVRTYVDAYVHTY